VHGKDAVYIYEKRIKPGTKALSGMVSSIIRTIFAQNDQESAREQLRHVVDELKIVFQSNENS